MNSSITVSSLRGQIDEILPRVAKPARYMGGELNCVVKPPEKQSVRIALAFPDVYEVGMSNLGLRILYSILNDMPAVAAERVFAPASDMEDEMRSAGIPLFSLESALPIDGFDILGFSLAYELCYTTVLNMLDLAAIPVLSRDRTNDHPIVIAGGHCATNPEPMVDFIDAFAIGDGEEIVVDIVRAYEENRGNRVKVMEALSKIEGVYVPGITKDSRVRSRIVRDLEKAPFPTKLVVPFTAAVHDRVTLEIMRGCSRGCRFCQAGMITRPVRERSVGTICRQASELLENSGYEEVALTSLSSADHSAIGRMVRTLIDSNESQGVGISLPSLRADAECVHLAAEIQRVRKSGLTFAPEAGTQRLRDVINKNVSQEDLLGAVEAAVESGWRRLKLYFMIGLPTETDEDLEGIGALVTKVIDIGRKHRVPLTLNVTLSPFVPKPHTPFQWRAMATPEELERKLTIVRPLLRGKNIQLSWHDPSASRVEAALARGDRSLGPVILGAWRRGGKLEQDNFSRARWAESFEEAGLDIAQFANRVIAHDEPLAWDLVDVQVSKSHLIHEDKKATSEVLTGDCRFGTCSACGIREALVAIDANMKCPPVKPEPIDYVIPKQRERASSGRAVLFTFTKGEDVKWLGHLDVMRVFERAVRMSGIDVVHTQGFNPRVKMSIASALGVGVTASRELITIFIAEPIDVADSVKRLNASLPPGIRIIEAQLLAAGEKGPAITGSELLLEVSLPGKESLEKLQKAADALLALDEIPYLRQSDKKRRNIDLRPGIEALEITGAPESRAIITLRLRHLEYTVKPSEIIEMLSREVPGILVLATRRERLVF